MAVHEQGAAGHDYALVDGDQQAQRGGANALAPSLLRGTGTTASAARPPRPRMHCPVQPAAHLHMKSVLRSHRKTPSGPMARDRPSAEGEASKHRRDVGCHGALGESSHGR